MENQNDSGFLTTKKYINSSIYLVDGNNVVYTYKDNKPVILGVLKGELLDRSKFMNIEIDDPLVKRSLISC